MATVYFYEKSGCISNAKQKQLLIAAGHQLVVRNLLTEPWQQDRLRAFFGALAVRDWFNSGAPTVKSGEIDPESLSETQALALMLKNPLLIRRPLMQVGDELRVGFDQLAVDQWIGLDAVDTTEDVESCPRTLEQQRCSHE